MTALKRSIAGLPSTVLLLGLVSFFNDFSSEMIYPLLPVFLSSVLGAGALALGFIEGAAELTASVLKIVSGMWADRLARRKPLVAAGYSVSSFMRPLIGLAASWPMVFVLRVIDRVGKGVRTSPRDALIADVTDENCRGMAFGVQRGFDHAGAVAGPLVAMALLTLGLSLRNVFILSAVPALAVVLIVVFFLKESPVRRSQAKVLHLFQNWTALGSPFRRMLFAIILFTLGNSTDAFLLLRLSTAGVSTEWIAGLWAVHHMVKVVAATYGGWMSDKVGRRVMVASGWFYYAIIYAAFAFLHSTGALIVTFILYGVYYGLTEPSERAWVTDLVPKELRGEAFGWYNGAIGIAALPASALFGVIWVKFSPEAAFMTGAGLALIAAAFLLTVRLKPS
jgi:MFS family permease